jgi:hypothetical protein
MTEDIKRQVEQKMRDNAETEKQQAVEKAARIAAKLKALQDKKREQAVPEESEMSQRVSELDRRRKILRSNNKF